jgi:hypothetical protein
VYHHENENDHVIQVIDKNLNQFHDHDHVQHQKQNHLLMLMGKTRFIQKNIISTDYFRRSQSRGSSVNNGIVASSSAVGVNENTTYE